MTKEKTTHTEEEVQKILDYCNDEIRDLREVAFISWAESRHFEYTIPKPTKETIDFMNMVYMATPTTVVKGRHYTVVLEEIYKGAMWRQEQKDD